MTYDRYEPAALAEALANELIKTLSDATRQVGNDDANAALAQGKIFQLAGYFEEAITCFKSAAARDPQLDEAKARLAMAQTRAHHNENALATAMDLAQSNPGFEFKEMTSDQVMTAMTLLGDMLVKNKRTKDATHAYRVAAERYRNDAFAAGRLAQAMLVHGEPEQAIAQLPEFSSNPRFRALEKILNLGREIPALLPRYNADHLQAMIAVSDHGRPMVVDGKFVVAPLVDGDCGW